MRFLSSEWFWEASEKLNSDPDLRSVAAGATFRFWLVAEGAPDWASDITVAVDRGTVDLDEGCTGRADAVGRAAYSDWLAMLRHDLHPRAAALTGRLRGRGPLTILRNYRVIDTALDVLRTIPVDE